MKFFTQYLSLSKCYGTAGKLQCLLQPIVLGCFIVSLIWALFIAPIDFQQGEGYRIIYIHVPSAFLSLSLYLTMGVMSFIFLIWRLKIAALMISNLAKIGIVFSALALITGSIWGKPMWGTWWIWDARLTSTLVLFFLYLGVLVLHSALVRHNSADKACAVLALIGTINIPIIHYSVSWWNTLHQGATITKVWAPTIDISMLKPLLFMLMTFILYTITLLCMLLRQSIYKRESNSKWLQQRTQ